MTAFGSGFDITNAPNVTKAREAANNIFNIIDNKTDIDVRK